MKLSLFFFFTLLIFSCATSGKVSQDSIQKALFDTTFNYADVRAIELVEIEHPMLGGIISTKTLNKQQRELFISKLKRLEYTGIYKCASIYVIRVILEKDTLRLKTCGERLSAREADEYYCLPDSEKIIGDFIKE